MSIPLGELFGLLAAACWATGGVLFSRAPLPAWAINLTKNAIAGAALLATFVAIGVARGGVETAVDLGVLAWLVPSAYVGIVLGDTWYLRALKSVGPRKAMVIETLVPGFGLALGWFVLGELVPPLGLLGMTVTLAGVVMVVGDGPAAPARGLDAVDSPTAGVVYAVLAALAQAIGAAWSKRGILRLEELGAADAPLEASVVRVVTAAVLGLAIAAAFGRLRPLGALLRRPGVARWVIPSALIGTYLGIWLSMLAFRHTSIAVATTLNSTTPIFVLPIVALFLRQRVTRRGVLGAVVAVAGVVILVRA